MNSKNRLQHSIKKRGGKIKLLIMDVDGVLTPGYMVITSLGEEIKVFNVHDGFGITLWRKAGLKSAIITAGRTDALIKRAECLKIDKLYQNARDKLVAYNRLKSNFKVMDEEVAFIGDDLIDLPVLKRAGLSCCVSNAHDQVKESVHYLCKREGGKGAVREVIDIILKSK